MHTFKIGHEIIRKNILLELIWNLDQRLNKWEDNCDVKDIFLDRLKKKSTKMRRLYIFSQLQPIAFF